MENAAEALKMAGFIMIFVVALSVAMFTIMKGKNASETVLKYSDKDLYRDEISYDENKQVKKLTVSEMIPTLYHYAEEKYIVIFYDFNGKPLKIVDEEKLKSLPFNKKFKNYIPNIRRKNNGNFNGITFLNYDVELKYNEEWTATFETRKKYVDCVVEYLINTYGGDKKFTESLRTTQNIYETNQVLKNPDDSNKNLEYPDSSSNNENDEKKDKEVRVITYTITNE